MIWVQTPNAFTAGWSRSDLSGKNIFQYQSVSSTDKSKPPEFRVSDSVLSSPPKNGCIDINPIRFKLENSYSLALTAMWCTKLPPALSPAIKPSFGFTFTGSLSKFSSKNFKSSSLKMASEKTAIYHESCLLHSLNNLFQQKDAFTRASLNEIAEKLVLDDPDKQTWTLLSVVFKPHQNSLTEKQRIREKGRL
ncbi:hypothetical protein Q3G72_031220 [Acer saccharum]|nr:hypothetical protein Q3G72_031220 [Acer saccharum]